MKEEETRGKMRREGVVVASAEVTRARGQRERGGITVKNVT